MSAEPLHGNSPRPTGLHSTAFGRCLPTDNESRWLVKRCLAGEPVAWESLYDSYHVPLVDTIKNLLAANRFAPPDASLVDELAARVWYALVANRGRSLASFLGSPGIELTALFCALAMTETRRILASRFGDDGLPRPAAS
jgi:hypothetical protein